MTKVNGELFVTLIFMCLFFVEIKKNNTIRLIQNYFVKDASFKTVITN